MPAPRATTRRAILGLAAALDALRAARLPLSVNLKVFLEGEEEAGSPHLAAILEKYRDRLKADIWLLCDGPVHQTRRMQVFFGARGVTGVEITVYGADPAPPQRPLRQLGPESRRRSSRISWPGCGTTGATSSSRASPTTCGR